VHAEVILVDIGAWFAIALCRFSVANWILRYKRRHMLYFQSESHLNRSGTAKPTDSPGLKNWLFWFDLIRCGLQALAGRRQRRTTRRV
jgi:hypothetical protein